MTNDLKSYAIIVKMPSYLDYRLSDLLSHLSFEAADRAEKEYVRDILESPIGCGVLGQFSYMADAPEDKVHEWANEAIDELNKLVPDAELAEILLEK